MDFRWGAEGLPATDKAFGQKSEVSFCQMRSVTVPRTDRHLGAQQRSRAQTRSLPQNMQIAERLGFNSWGVRSDISPWDADQ